VAGNRAKGTMRGKSGISIVLRWVGTEVGESYEGGLGESIVFLWLGIEQWGNNVRAKEKYLLFYSGWEQRQGGTTVCMLGRRRNFHCFPVHVNRTSRKYVFEMEKKVRQRKFEAVRESVEREC